MQSLNREQKITGVAFIVLLLLLIATAWYGYTRIATLSNQVAELASTTNHLESNIAEATTSLGDALQKERQNVQAQIGGVKDQVGSIGGTVTDLQKLSMTDPELLAKYSKVFFLSDNYAPARLVPIPEEYRYNEKLSLQIIPEVLPRLAKMLDAAKADGADLYVDSAYRSFREQQAVKTSYTVAYGSGTANSFSADQGYSEHQLGTTVDLITTGTGGRLAGFDTKPAYDWVVENAYKYGFVLSYPKSNGYYIYEPWHWRFVGIKLATDLHKQGKYFYELDQRTIDTYLINLFDS